MPPSATARAKQERSTALSSFTKQEAKLSIALTRGLTSSINSLFQEFESCFLTVISCCQDFVQACEAENVSVDDRVVSGKSPDQYESDIVARFDFLSQKFKIFLNSSPALAQNTPSAPAPTREQISFRKRDLPVFFRSSCRLEVLQAPLEVARGAGKDQQDCVGPRPAGFRQGRCTPGDKWHLYWGG